MFVSGDAFAARPSGGSPYAFRWFAAGSNGSYAPHNVRPGRLSFGLLVPTTLLIFASPLRAIMMILFATNPGQW
jgi:hypothetical protein